MSGMTRCWRRWDWKLARVSCLAIGGAIASSVNCALAQITPDGTLPNNSIVTPSGNTSIIEGGTQAGSNLFHSFEQFSVLTGSEAYFNNAADIQNIISRVTGGSISNIDGLLRANGTANLFLLNPNGIIFGPNAELDIGGSFVGSTASSLNFADGTQFSATAPQTTPLLTVSVPLGLQFGGTAGSIRNQSQATNSSGDLVGLEVQPGKTLALVGGDVRLEGGGLQALGGNVELSGLAASGSIGLSMNGSQSSLSFPDDVQRADVYLTNSGSNTARVNVAASNGGSIAITAQNIDISGGSVLRGGLETGLGLPGTQAGDIELSAQGAIKVGNSFIANNVRAGSVGKAGNIDITAGSLSVTNGAQLQTLTLGQGNAGSLNINARDTISFDGGYAFGTVELGAVGNGGDINITTGSLALKNGAQLIASSSGQGDAGSVFVQANDSVSLANSSYIFNNVESGAVGNVGGINITSGSLSLTDGGQIQSLIRDASNELRGGRGNGGNVVLDISGPFTVSGSSNDGYSSAIFTSVGSGAEGNSGNINVTTESLSLTNRAQLNSSTSGQGNAGSVNIFARDTVTFDGSYAFSEVKSGAVGNSGGVNIATGALSVTNGAALSTSTFGRGNAGSVTINTRDTVTFDGGDSLFSTVGIGGVGNGGNINITTGSLYVINGARLTASTFAQGDAGSMNINARDTVSFYGISNGRQSLAFSTVEPGAVGNSGDINITTGSLFLTDSAYLTTQTNGSGNSGNINIQAQQLSLNSDASLRGDVSPTGRGRGANINLDVKGKILLTGADSFYSGESTRITIGVLPGGVGSGGDLDIKAGSLVLTNGAIIKNSNQGQGNAGNIQINADFVDISGSVPNTGLPSGLFTSTETTGSAGNIFIDTHTFRIADGAALSARSRGGGQGGDIRVNSTSSFEAVNGGQLVTTAFGQGQAGNILVNATDRVTISGSDPNYANRIAKFPSSSYFANNITETGAASGLFANTETNSTGQGGDLTITTGQLVVRDGAQVNVSSTGKGNAGNLEVASRDLRLDNRAVLSSSTFSGEGGNIKLRSQDLILMRRNSEISTQARGTGNGGNIDIIDADLIVAVPGENSDIVADAIQGNGGNINITTSGIFGIEFRERRTSQSDITASSDFGLDGTVDINTPDVDPNRGLTNLPVEPVDTEVAQGCTAGGTVAQSKFIVTGRGGLPPNPGDTLSTDAVMVDLITLNPEVEQSSNTAVSTSPTSLKPARIVEAQGWVIDANGEVILTANAPTVTPHSSWQTPANCHVPKTSS